MTHAELRHALGALCIDGPDGLWVHPTSERQLIDALQVLTASGARLHREVFLSRAGLKAVSAIDVVSSTAVAQAGVPMADLEKGLHAHGLSLGPLSAGAMAQTLGDFLEGPYAGLRPVRGGRLEPLTLSLTAVTVDGRVVKTHGAPRSAAGPDLNALFLGADARLGLITQAVVRAMPRGDAAESFVLSLPSPLALIDVLKAALSDGALPDSVRVERVGPRVFAAVALTGLPDAVARDAASLKRRADAVGGRVSGEAKALVAHSVEREAGWLEIEAALESTAPLLLSRLSLHSAIVQGPVEGQRLDVGGAWPALTASLCAHVDSARTLGGAP